MSPNRTTMRLSITLPAVLTLALVGASISQAQTPADGAKPRPLSDTKGEDSSLTFPTGRDLSRTIVRRNSGVSEVQFPTGVEARPESEALRKLDETTLRVTVPIEPKVTKPAPAAPSQRVGISLPEAAPVAVLTALGVGALAVQFVKRRRRRAEWIHIS